MRKIYSKYRINLSWIYWRFIGDSHSSCSLRPKRSLRGGFQGIGILLVCIRACIGMELARRSLLEGTNNFPKMMARMMVGTMTGMVDFFS